MFSVVAGIVDRGDGFHVVVGPLGNMFCHKGQGERIYVHPTLIFQGSVPDHAVFTMMNTMMEYVRERRMP